MPTKPGEHVWDWKFAKENFGLAGYLNNEHLPGGFWVQCKCCLLVKKLLPNRKIWVYRVNNNWTTTRPDCRVIASGE